MLSIQEYTTLDSIDFAVYAQAASSIRTGHSCTAPDRGAYAYEAFIGQGGSNLHLPLTFDDGVVWLARIRRVRWYNPSKEVLWANVDSEAATLRTMADRGIPVPGAYPAPTQYRGEVIFYLNKLLEH